VTVTVVPAVTVVDAFEITSAACATPAKVKSTGALV
jgi:hypothetical protein